MRVHPRVATLVLPTIGALSAAAYAWLTIRVGGSTSDLPWMVGALLALAVAWAVALWWTRTHPARLSVLVGFAVLFRLLLLPAGYDRAEGRFDRFLLFDDRVWRYLWDGHAWTLGASPLEAEPSQLDQGVLSSTDAPTGTGDDTVARWEEVLDNVSERDHASTYPIGAQALFRLSHAVAPGSVWAWKALMVLFDLSVVALLVRFSRAQGLGTWPVLAYAWNPLVIKEFAGSGHVDAALVCLMVLALGRKGVAASVWIAVAALVKPVAFVLVPAVVRRGGWQALVAPALAVVLFVRHMPRGLLPLLLDTTFNPMLYRVFPLPGPLLGVVTLGVLAVVAGVAVWRDDGSDRTMVRHAVWLVGAVLVLTPVLAPWYLTWILPFAGLASSPFWLALSATSLLAYVDYLDFVERPLLVAVEFFVPVLAWWWYTRVRGRSEEPSESRMSLRAVVSTSSVVAGIGGLCCLTPIVLVLLGMSSVSFAASLGTLLYGEYRWLFRLVSVALGAIGLVVYLRSAGVCSLDAARRRRRFVVDVALLTTFSSATAYIFFTYVALQEWGIRVGLPWAQYDESWAYPAGTATLAAAALVFTAARRRFGTL